MILLLTQQLAVAAVGVVAAVVHTDAVTLVNRGRLLLPVHC
jgi:hypothetical protein